MGAGVLPQEPGALLVLCGELEGVGEGCARSYPWHPRWASLSQTLGSKVGIVTHQQDPRWAPLPQHGLYGRGSCPVPALLLAAEGLAGNMCVIVHPLVPRAWLQVRSTELFGAQFMSVMPWGGLGSMRWAQSHPQLSSNLGTEAARVPRSPNLSLALNQPPKFPAANLSTVTFPEQPAG